MTLGRKSSPTRTGESMIMGSFGRYLPVETARDHEVLRPQRATTSAAQPQDQNTPLPSWP